MSKNLIRRGSFFHYRRRIPSAAGGGVIQVPLLTDHLSDGRRIALILAVEQDRAFASGHDVQTVRGLLAEAARKEAALATLGIVSIPDDAERRPTLPPAPRGFDPSISAVVDRLLARKKEDGVGRAQDTQIRAVSRLFVEAIEETDIRAVTQGHLAAFRGVMSRIPKSHGKSERQRGKPISEILDAARSLPPAKVGLSPATVNRNLEIVRQILRSAATEGIVTVEGVDTSRLRRRDNVRARDKRSPFSTEDCRAIFSSPIWTGSRSEKRRRFPGEIVIRDALFWVPIIAAYTGARREEIAGLMPEDVAFEDGSWVFKIRPNRLRPGLKTAASARVIPAHQDLVRAGLFSGLIGWAERKIGGSDGSDSDGPDGARASLSCSTRCSTTRLGPAARGNLFTLFGTTSPTNCAALACRKRSGSTSSATQGPIWRTRFTAAPARSQRCKPLSTSFPASSPPPSCARDFLKRNQRPDPRLDSRGFSELKFLTPVYVRNT